MTRARLFDSTRCQLGEGPLWHPTRQELFWFDIIGRKLHCRSGERLTSTPLSEICTAAGWIDEKTLLICSESAISTLDLSSGTFEKLVPLEADNPLTRSNDGRADPQGGFWISTMGKKAEPGLGSLYRFYRGEVRTLYSGLNIPNSICFAPEGDLAYWADTSQKKIMAQRLDTDGWPEGEASVFIDLNAEGLNPDGSVVDAKGHLWNAQWGAGRVAEYDRQGRFVAALPLPAKQSTCPAFIGSDLGDLICTSAAEGLDKASEAQGQTFVFEGVSKGQAEHRVIL